MSLAQKPSYTPCFNRASTGACDALPPLTKIPIRIRICEFMSFLAMSFLATVGGHCKTFKKYSSLRIKQFLQRRAFFSSLDDCICLETGKLRKDVSLVCDTIHCHFTGIAPIQHLIFLRRPFAIAGFVIAIIVNSFNRKAFRSFSHILKECREAVRPSSTHSNAAPAVVGIRRMLGIAASLFHVEPYFINRMSALRVHMVTHGQTIAHDI